VASKEAMAEPSWIEVSRTFWDEVRVEFRKVHWPNQNETVAGTVSVLVVVAIIASALGVVDWVLSLVMSQVLP